MKIQFVGGGLICYELYPEKGSGIWYPAVVLGEEMYGKTRKKYGDFGGGMEKIDRGNVDRTIIREALEEDYGPVVFLVNFKTSSNPFWNMKRMGNVAKKCDVILSGMETIGSAERSCNEKEMRSDFKTQSDGIYAKTLYNHFGSERVLKELESYLSFDFIPRSGGGIGVTRLIKSMQKEKLL